MSFSTINRYFTVKEAHFHFSKKYLKLVSSNIMDLVIAQVYDQQHQPLAAEYGRD